MKLLRPVAQLVEPPVAVAYVKNIWLGCCAPGIIHGRFAKAIGASRMHSTDPLSCALRNSAFGL